MPRPRSMLALLARLLIVMAFFLPISAAHAFTSGPAAVALSNAPAMRAAAVSGVAPILAHPSDMTVTAGDTADQTLHATDADGDPLTFSKAFGPTYMTITTMNPGTGAAVGNVHLAPGPSDTGPANASVGVTDGLFADQASFQIKTLGPDVAPVLTQPLDMTVGEGEAQSQTLHASDANGDPLGFYLASGPAYAIVTTVDPGTGSGVGEITVSPGFGSHGTANATVGATDGVLTDEKTLSITVTKENAAPVLTQPSNMNVRVGEIKDQALSASDPNADPVTFSTVSGPAYMTVTTVDATAGMGNVRLNPGSGDVGAQTVMVMVTDGDLSDQKSFVVSTRADVAPILYQPSPVVVLAGSTAYQTLGANDSDGDSLVFSKAAGPTYMSVTTGYNTIASVGILQLAPTASDVGLASGTVRVSDGLLSDEKTVSIETVSELPSSPFPVNDTGTYEIGIQGQNGSAPGTECPPPLGMTGGLLSREWVGDDAGDYNVYSVLSFDTKPWTRGSSFSLHVQEQDRVGIPFGSLGAGVIIEYLRSSNPLPNRFVNTAEVEGAFNLFRLVSEADLFATGGIDLTDLINGILQSPGSRYLYLRFRFPICTDGDHTNDQIVFYSGGPAGESRATRIDEAPAPCPAGSFTLKTKFVGSGLFDVQTADLNADGRLDLVVVGAPGVVVLPGAGDGSFGAPLRLTVGTDPVSGAIADLNGDGVPDLAIADYSSDNISVFLGDGSGGFGPKRDFPTGGVPRSHSVAIGDIDRDGKPDMVVTRPNSASVSVLRGVGDGTFGVSTSVYVGGSPWRLVMPDLNGDGSLDVIVTDLNGYIGVLLNNGAGVLTLDTNYSLGSGPEGIAAADLNGDGKTDVVVACRNSDFLSVFLGKGNGSLGPRVDYATGGGPIQIAIADLNGDGLLDLASANYNSNDASILLGNGAGALGSHTDIAAGNLPYGIAAGDLDKDLRTDLVVANYFGSLSIFLNGCAPARELAAAVDLDPNVINLKSDAPWVTAYVEPTGFDPASINVSTLRLAGSVPPVPKFAVVGDRNRNGVPDLMVKFSREALDPLLVLGVNSLEVTGSLVTGEKFAGTDQVRVINPGGGHNAASVAPNPLNPLGVLAFTTVNPGRVRVTMFDLQGRLVRTLLETPHLPAGEHEVRIDGRGERGEVLPSGVYFYRVGSPDGSVTGRFAILK